MIPHLRESKNLMQCMHWNLHASKETKNSDEISIGATPTFLPKLKLNKI